MDNTETIFTKNLSILSMNLGGRGQIDHIDNNI
jgi:hypothetical protein